jgi:hypothetical protein
MAKESRRKMESWNRHVQFRFAGAACIFAWARRCGEKINRSGKQERRNIISTPAFQRFLDKRPA